jgi:homoserine trans-succinylase
MLILLHDRLPQIKILATKQLKKNAKIADKKSAGKYKITKVTKKNGMITGGTVTYMKPYSKWSKVKKVKIKK